jgi:hypothetical protein
MPKKISEWSKAQLVAVDLPMHGDSYTVISHQSVIDYVYTELAVAGFGVVSETFRATADGQIAHGIHVLQYQSDPELSMMFAWTNSYNKQVKFKCGVGAYVNQVGTFMVHGDMGSWARKHTGTADEETIETIKGQIKDAQMYYDQLKSDKDAMKEIKMNKRKQAQLLGILFAEYQILTTEQANIVRSEMIKPTHVFEDTSSLWAFYNYVTGALQTSHPKTWMEDQRILHYFISTIGNFNKPATPVQSVIAQQVETEVVDPLYAIPGQTNILDQIADLEADQIDEDIRYAANDDSLPQVSDNQVVQKEVNCADDLHQSEEVVEEADEDIEVPFDIDADDDAVLDAILVPIEKPEPEITIEEDLLPPGLLDEAVMKYTDPAGNTFEAPIDYAQFELDIAEEYKNQEANLNEIEDEFDFDLDESTEEQDNTPDFF